MEPNKVKHFSIVINPALLKWLFRLTDMQSINDHHEPENIP
jgi:hypothetical protein